MKLKLFVSFSGGKSSAYMTKRLIDEWSDYFDFIFVFANTGQEREETLIFIKQCAIFWNIEIIWIEAITHHNQRKGSTHRIVTFDTASRNGEPFEDMVSRTCRFRTAPEN